MPRTTLTRDAIIDAAFALLDAGGLDAITTRALAERLGVRPGALYYHVADMAALRDAMGTRITIELLEHAGEVAQLGWRQLLVAMGTRMREVLLRYPDGARLVSGTLLLDDEALRAIEHPLTALVRDGFSPLDAQRALTTVNAYVTGFVIEEQHRRAPGGESYDAGVRRGRLDPEAQPLSWQLSDEVAELPESSFDWALEAIVDGLGARAGVA